LGCEIQEDKELLLHGHPFCYGCCKSLQGNICAQLFVSDRGFVAFYPMKKQQDFYLAIKQFAKEVGAPEALVCDPHPAQIKCEV
jgi:hypothetical protein